MIDHINNPEDLRTVIKWGFGIIGTLLMLGLGSIKWFIVHEIKKYDSAMNSLSETIQRFMEECHRCQIEALKSFVPKDEYVQLLGMRTEAHKIINSRLGELENGQVRIADKLDTFHKDMQEKTNRLSKTFVFRDAVISMRLDNISDRIGVEKWTRKKEEELAKKLESEFDLNERKMNNL